jgi:hypothetical protein
VTPKEIKAACERQWNRLGVSLMSDRPAGWTTEKHLESDLSHKGVWKGDKGEVWLVNTTRKPKTCRRRRKPALDKKTGKLVYR